MYIKVDNCCNLTVRSALTFKILKHVLLHVCVHINILGPKGQIGSPGASGRPGFDGRKGDRGETGLWRSDRTSR